MVFWGRATGSGAGSGIEAGVTRSILHIDMDAFFASVEQRDDPSLRGKPVLVGGQSRRGVVAAASYEARTFGARSAMPMAEALRLCPQAIVVPPRRGRYAEVSAHVFDIFRRHTPLVEGLAFDEAFLDVTASRELFGDAETIARRIKKTIFDETGLTASAGVAPCKFVAKIASDLKKPDGLVVVREGEVAAFLAPLPIERMWRVGKKAAPELRAAGLKTIGDIARAHPATLERILGSFGREAQQLARGEDDREVIADSDPKSIGAEETFEHDLFDIESLERHLLAQSSRVAMRLVEANLSARVVVVKLKYADFTLKTRRITLPEPVRDTQSIYKAARDLVRRMPFPHKGVRLTGVAVADFEEGATLSLFPDEQATKSRKVEEVRKQIADRFGNSGLTLATLLNTKSKPPSANQK